MTEFELIRRYFSRAPKRALLGVGDDCALCTNPNWDVEAKGFGELSVTPESRSLAHVFLASTAAKNDPQLPGAPRARGTRVPCRSW